MTTRFTTDHKTSSTATFSTGDVIYLSDSAPYARLGKRTKLVLEYTGT